MYFLKLQRTCFGDGGSGHYITDNWRHLHSYCRCKCYHDL